MRNREDLSHEDIEQLWAEEAARRDAEIDSGIATIRDVEDVLRDARAQASLGIDSKYTLYPERVRRMANPYRVQLIVNNKPRVLAALELWAGISQRLRRISN